MDDAGGWYWLAPPPVPAAFIAPARPETPNVSVPSWATLGDATAAQLIACVRAENPDIAALVARLAAARASAAATAAARQPTLTASSSATITQIQFSEDAPWIWVWDVHQSAALV